MPGSSNPAGSYPATMSVRRLTSLDPQMPCQRPDRLPAGRRPCSRPSKMDAAARSVCWRSSPPRFERDWSSERAQAPPVAARPAALHPRDVDSVIHGSCVGPSRLLCGRCSNLEAARRSGLVDFVRIEFEPLTMSDVRGHEHAFAVPHPLVRCRRHDRCDRTHRRPFRGLLLHGHRARGRRPARIARSACHQDAPRPRKFGSGRWRVWAAKSATVASAAPEWRATPTAKPTCPWS